jgi:hypothetical protein
LSKLKLLLICQKYQLGREYLPIHTALEGRFELSRYFVDDGWPARLDDLPGARGFDAILWYVRFRELVLRPAFDWHAYEGMRLMYDQDSYMNYSLLAGEGRYLGAWPRVYERDKLDVLLCTGRGARASRRQRNSG